jgi:hypothetical protein
MAQSAPKALNTEQAARRFAAVLRAVLSAPPEARKAAVPKPQKASRKRASHLR